MSTHPKIQHATFRRIKTNVPGFLRNRYRSAQILGRLPQFAKKWQKSKMPLFEELRQTSRDFCESDIDPHRSWDVCPNSPKSGKSIFSVFFSRKYWLPLPYSFFLGINIGYRYRFPLYLELIR